MKRLEIHTAPPKYPRRDDDGMIVHGPAPTISGFFAAIILGLAFLLTLGWVMDLIGAVIERVFGL
jgi:hypothetical protein